jgi:hypothetical protein
MYPHALSKYSPPYVDNRPPALAGYYGKKRRKKKEWWGSESRIAGSATGSSARSIKKLWNLLETERENRRLFRKARNQVETLLFYS